MTAPAQTAPLRGPRPAPRRAPRTAPAPAQTRRTDLRVVAPPRRRTRTTAIVCLGVVLVFGALLASAVFHSVLVSSQSRLDHMNASITTEKANLERAKLALAKAQSPERIAAEATALGMVPPDQVTWVAPDSPDRQVVTGTTVPSAGAAG